MVPVVVRILPALLVGSGLKLFPLLKRWAGKVHSPGFIGREWIETCIGFGGFYRLAYSPGFIGREWIETSSDYNWIQNTKILPALLVGSGLKRWRA